MTFLWVIDPEKKMDIPHCGMYTETVRLYIDNICSFQLSSDFTGVKINSGLGSVSFEINSKQLKLLHYIKLKQDFTGHQ